MKHITGKQFATDADEKPAVTSLVQTLDTDTRRGAMVGQTLHQCWLRWGQRCTVCNMCATYSSKLDSISVSECYFIFSTSLYLDENNILYTRFLTSTSSVRPRTNISLLILFSCCTLSAYKTDTTTLCCYCWKEGKSEGSNKRPSPTARRWTTKNRASACSHVDLSLQVRQERAIGGGDFYVCSTWLGTPTRSTYE